MKQADVLAYHDSHKDIEGVHSFSRSPAARNTGVGGTTIGDFFDGIGELFGDLGDFSL